MASRKKPAGPKPILRIADHSYTAEDPDDELTFRRGDIFVVLGKGEDRGWLKGKLRGSERVGLFPINYTKPYEEEEDEEKEDSETEEEEDDEDVATYQEDPESEDEEPKFYAPPGRRDDRLEIPALNHVELTENQKKLKNKGRMNVELPSLNHVDKPSSQNKDSAATAVLELPSLRKVEGPAKSAVDTSASVLELPSLRKVEAPPKTTAADVAAAPVLELPSLRKVDPPSKPNAAERTAVLDVPQLRPVETKPQVAAPKPTPVFEKPQLRIISVMPPGFVRPSATPSSHFHSEVSESAKPPYSVTSPVAPRAAPAPSFQMYSKPQTVTSEPPGMEPPKPSWGVPKQPQSKPIPLPHMAKSSIPPMPSISEDSNASEMASSRPRFQVAQPSTSAPKPPAPPKPTVRQPVSSFAASTSSQTSSKIIQKRIPARSLNTTEPPPAEFYSAETDSYTCSVQVTKNGRSTEKVESFTVLRADRSEVVITIHQTSGESEALLTAEIKPFQGYSPSELDGFANEFGGKIVAFCQANFGKRVGDGECWTLAEKAFEAARCAPPAAYNFGQEVALDKVCPGDIMQFKSCVFEFPNGGKQFAGTPNHTAIVAAPVSETLIPVYEQNPKPCSLGTYDLSCLVSGDVLFFRPLPRRG